MKKITNFFQNLFWTYTLNEIDADIKHIQYHLDYCNNEFVIFHLKMYIHKYSGNKYPKFIRKQIDIFHNMDKYYKKAQVKK